MKSSQKEIIESWLLDDSERLDITFTPINTIIEVFESLGYKEKDRQKYYDGTYYLFFIKDRIIKFNFTPFYDNCYLLKV